MKSFCEKQLKPKSHFDPKSFRWKSSGKSRILIGCPRGKWNAQTKRCKVGTAGYKILVPGATCPAGTKRIRKR